MNRFYFIIHHCPGRLSTGPDELSRRSDHEVPAEARDNGAVWVLALEQVAGGVSEAGGGTTVAEANWVVKRAVVLDIARCARSTVVAKVGQTILDDTQILERIWAASRKDPRLDAMWSLALAPVLVCSRLKDFMVDNGVVQFCGLIYVPDNNEVKHLVLQLYHDAILARHPGQLNMLALVARNYYWPRMSEFINRYVDHCKTCQHTKPRRQRPHGPLQPLEIPEGPWQHVSTDFISPLLPSRGFDMIQVVCDKLTKRVHFLPAHQTDTVVEACDQYIKKVWCLHGTPKKFVCD